jgi:hypothetical protein
MRSDGAGNLPQRLEPRSLLTCPALELDVTRPRRLATAAIVAALAAEGSFVGAWLEREDRGAHRAAFLSGAVTFSLPPAWIVQGWMREDGAEGVAAFIPCASLDDTAHSANANLLVEPNVEGEGLAAWSARRFAVAAPRRVDEERGESAWRTVVSTGFDRGARYVVVERFGVSPRGRVHAVAAFPALDGVGDRWFEQIGDDIDGFLGSLVLADAPPSGVHVGWDGRTMRLADSDSFGAAGGVR